MGMFESARQAMSGKGLAGLLQAIGVDLNDKESISSLIQRLTGEGGSAGIRSLVERFSQAGHGDAVKSWAGTGEKQPVSGEAVMQALGRDKIESFAQQLGVPAEQASDALAKILPEAVGKMRPEGRVGGQA